LQEILKNFNNWRALTAAPLRALMPLTASMALMQPLAVRSVCRLARFNARRLTLRCQQAAALPHTRN